MNLTAIQEHLRASSLTGWLVYDFRGSNSVFAQLLPGKRSTTRRALLWIPATGEAVLLVNPLDRSQFASPGVRVETYLTWNEFEEWIRKAAGLDARVAMEYVPSGALPVMSIVDGGTLELVRSLGITIHPSANLVQTSVATWSDAALQKHLRANELVGAIKDEAFELIGEQCRAGREITERDVQQFILKRFGEEGLFTPDGPIVATNAHAGDPHFDVPETGSSVIRPGDWVLIDLWGRLGDETNVFADITWTAFVGDRPGEEHQRIFDAVTAARDASLALAQTSAREGRKVEGWQLDDAAREVLLSRGYGEFIRHRTGHSLSPGSRVHGMGMNLDNIESHDVREMAAQTGFTIEPGLYLPTFGVRSEINVYVDADHGAIVTSQIQREIVLV